MGFLKELTAKIGFDIDPKPLEDLDKGLEAIKYGLLELAITAGGAVEAFYEITKTTAETREQMLKMSEQAGMSIESFSQLSNAARLGHMNMEEFGMAFTHLNRQLFDVSQGSFNASKAFSLLGIHAGQLRGKNTEQAFDMIAAKLKDMPSGIKKVTAATEIFGVRGGAKLIPFINRLDEFKEATQGIGLEVDESKAKKAEEFMVSLELLKLNMVGIKNVIADEFMPVVEEIIHSMTDWLKQNRELIKANLIGFMKALGHYLQNVWFWGKQVATAFMDVIRGFGGAEKATNLFLTAMGILTGIALLYGLGMIAKGIWGLVEAFLAMDVSAMAIPLAIGAIIAALVLLAEDVYSYFEGKDSITGIFAEKFPNAMKVLIAIFKIWRAEMTVLFDIVTAPFRFMLWAIDTIATKIAGSKWLSKLLDFKFDSLGAFADKVGGTADAVTKYANPFGSPVPGTQGAAAPSVTNHIEVNTQPGMSPQQQIGAVSSGISDGLESIFRQTRNATAVGAAY